MKQIIKKLKDAIQGKASLSAKRSSKWPSVRAEHLKACPTCAVCGGNKNIEVHHMVPFNVDVSRELDPQNLITLCESKRAGVNCHLWFGHLGNYQSFNATVSKDAKSWLSKFKNRPKP